MMRPRLALSLALILGLVGGCTSSAKHPAAAAPAHNKELAKKLDEILSSHGTKARYVCRVLELPSGRELYTHDADVPTIPASNLKLFTTATAVDRFGAAHTFKTTLWYDGKNLYVVGTGDPSLGDAKIADKHKQSVTALFDEWADALQKKGIKEIPGDLVYNDAALDDEFIHPSWSKSFAGDWYAAPVSGLAFNDNCVDITLFPTEDGKPMRYEILPPIKHIELVNQTKTASTQPATIDRKLDANVYTLGGGSKTKTTLESKAVVDPGAFFADALRTHLESKGIKLAGKNVRDTKWPVTKPAPTAQLIATHESSFTDALNRLNKNSQNLFAEAFSKLNGQDYAKQTSGKDVRGSWALGSDAAHAFLKKNHIDGSHVKLIDGSGLSRENRVTARAVSDLLLTMSRHKDAKAFYDSLPIGGVDGTIAKRQKDIAGLVHAKTGYIGGVRALSGYVTTRDGKQLIFSLIYNDIPGSVAPYEELQDEACRLLVSYPKLDYKPTPKRPSTRPTTQN